MPTYLLDWLKVPKGAGVGGHTTWIWHDNCCFCAKKTVWGFRAQVECLAFETDVFENQMKRYTVCMPCFKKYNPDWKSDLEKWVEFKKDPAAFKKKANSLGF